MRAFLADMCLRPSCYECTFKQKNRHSDITLADFWGIENVLPEFYDDAGVSLMIINSQKGAKLLETINSKLMLECVDIDEAIQYNPSMIFSANAPYDRKKFMKYVSRNGFDGIEKRFFDTCFIKRNIKKFFIKIIAHHTHYFTFKYFSLKLNHLANPRLLLYNHLPI